MKRVSYSIYWIYPIYPFFRVKKVKGVKRVNRVKGVKGVGILASILYTLICLLSLVAAFEFEKVSPILWVPTRHFVEKGNVNYMVRLRYAEPCEMITKQFDNWPDFSSSFIRYQMAPANFTHAEISLFVVYNQIHSDCIRQSNQWWQELLSITKMDQENNIHKVDKRGLLDFGGGVITGITISNIVSSVIQYINPDSDHHKINRIEEKLTAEQKLLNEYVDKARILNDMEKDILETVSKINVKVDKNAHDIEIMTSVIPSSSWLAAYLQTKIAMGIRDLRAVKKAFMRNKVATQAVANILNITELADIDDEQTVFYSLKKIQDSEEVLFNFAIKDKARDTSIYRLDPFKMWINLTTDPVYSEYVGKQYVLYNKTSDCAKAIEDPINTGVVDSCMTRHGRDQSMTLWRKSDYQPIRAPPTVKRNLRDNHIYCYDWEIFIDHREYQCPPYIFRLSTKHSFEINGMIYDAFSVDLNYSHFDKALDSLTLIEYHFPNQTNDELKLVHRIKELKRNLTTMEFKARSSIYLEPYDINWWLAVGILTANSIVLLYFIKQLFCTRSYSPNEPVYATVRKRVVERDFSDGLELIERPSTSKKKSHPTPPPPLE